MLDKQELAVLKILNKLALSSAYKVVTNEDILSLIPNKISIETEDIKSIVEFLGKNEYIALKFAEDNTYCYAINPKAKLLLSQEYASNTHKKSIPPALIFVFCMIASFIGTLIALLIFFYFTI